MSDEPEQRPSTFFRPPTPRPSASPGGAGGPAGAARGPASGGTSGGLPTAPKPGMSALEIEAMLAKDRSRTTSMWVPIALVVLALGALGYGMWFLTSRGARPDALAVAPAPQAPPRVSGDQRKAALEALAALRELRASVQARPSYQDYVEKTNATKASVEKFAGMPNVDPELRASFAQAINLYDFASAAWAAGLKGDQAATPQDAAPIYFGIASHPMIEVCGPLRDARNRAGEETTQIPPPIARGLAVTQNVPMIWTCAAERIAYLENALGGG